MNMNMNIQYSAEGSLPDEYLWSSSCVVHPQLSEFKNLLVFIEMSSKVCNILYVQDLSKDLTRCKDSTSIKGV